jgi:DNA-binding XRE family transcriptional regulator
LREFRNAKGISAKELAEELGLKTEAAYYMKENGMVRFLINEAKIVSRLFVMPIEDIFLPMRFLGRKQTF